MHYTLIVITTANSLHHYKVIIDQVILAVPESRRVLSASQLLLSS